jgi:hypothetical protein
VGFVRASAGRLGERVKLTQSRRDMRLRLLWIADIPLSLASFHRTRVQPRVTPTLPAALVSASSVRKGAPRAWMAKRLTPAKDPSAQLADAIAAAVEAARPTMTGVEDSRSVRAPRNGGAGRRLLALCRRAFVGRVRARGAS